MWLPVLITVLTGYLLGNLNGAVSVSTLLSHEDVRQHGSGNAGLTNFVRTFGPAKAILVFIIDMLKAVLACFVGKLLLEPYGLGQEGTMLGAFAVTLGHDFPALLGFHGGKGILCGLAIALCFDWRIAVIILVVFGAVTLLSRKVSLGSILASVSYGAGFAVLHHDNTFVMVCGIAISLLAVFMHRSNIARLCKGTENNISVGKK